MQWTILIKGSNQTPWEKGVVNRSGVPPLRECKSAGLTKSSQCCTCPRKSIHLDSPAIKQLRAQIPYSPYSFCLKPWFVTLERISAKIGSSCTDFPSINTSSLQLVSTPVLWYNKGKSTFFFFFFCLLEHILSNNNWASKKATLCIWNINLQVGGRGK